MGRHLNPNQAKIFGDTEDIMVYAEDIRVDHTTHELVVEAHGDKPGLRHIATEPGRTVAGKGTTEKIEQV